MTEDSEVYDQATIGKTRLIIDPDYEVEFTAVRETDVRGAALRGLREYITTLKAPWYDGTSLRFLRVVDAWLDAEALAKFPSAAIYTEEAGEFDSPAFTPTRETLPDGRILQVAAEYVQALTLDIYCTTTTERTALCAMLQDALEPVEWMAGCRLVLPHYHNAVCTYLKSSMTVNDSADSSGSRMRVASFSVVAALPQLRLVGAVPGLDIRTRAEVSDV